MKTNLSDRIHIGRSKLLSRIHGLEDLVALAATIPGWVQPPASREVAVCSYALPANAIIVEIGCFMGRSTVLLAGARQKRGSGIVHAIDPFDCSGDDFSVPHYEREFEQSGARNLEEAFRIRIARAGVSSLVEVHKSTSLDAVEHWTQPIDLLLLDGDQSPQGQRASYDRWFPHLKPGGILVLHNVGEREYAQGHDGGRMLELQEVKPPKFRRKRIIRYSLFAQKAN